jgi:glycosyltransferase involved in cell wall biosynthesis
VAKELRTLHVYSGNLWGGIETFLVTLARHAGLVGEWKSEFALSFRGRLSDELHRVGAVVHDLGEARLRAPWTILRSRRRLAEVVERGNFDAVVCHAAWCQSLFGSVARKAALRVFWLHDAPRGTDRFERLARLSRPDLCIANSRFSASTLDTIYPGIPLSVQYYPIDVDVPALSADERRRVRAELGANDDSVIIIQASRMEPWKGQRRLLAALGRLDPALPWLAVEVGGAQRPAERAYRAELERLAAELGISERVRFLGQRSDVPRLLAAADIHCQPNQGAEPFGIVFVEALAAGLPIVTFPLGGPQEIVTSDVGILAPDDAALSDALKQLVVDAPLRRRLGAAGPARAHELCDPRTRIPAIFRVLDEARRARQQH